MQIPEDWTKPQTNKLFVEVELNPTDPKYSDIKDKFLKSMAIPATNLNLLLPAGPMRTPRGLSMGRPNPNQLGSSFGALPVPTPRHATQSVNSIQIIKVLSKSSL